MKKYNKPELESVCFKVEEKLASTCTGSCETDIIGPNGIVFTGLSYSS